MTALIQQDIQKSGRLLAFQPPPHWRVIPLGYLFESVGGATPSKENEEYWSGKIPWVSPKDMKSHVITGSEDHISEAALNETRLTLLPASTILVVVRGMILVRTIPIAVSAIETTINQDMKGLFPKKGVTTEYFALLLRSVSSALFSTIEESGHGTRCLRLGLWRNILVGVPPEDEQQLIVRFVEERSAHLDALIEKKQRMIDLLNKKRLALISEAVTKGIEPSVPMIDTGCDWSDMVPAHWTPKKLKHLYRRTKRQDHSHKMVLSVYRDYGVIEKSSRDDNHNRTPDDLSVYQLVEPGNLVVNKMKAWQGSLGVSEHEGITSPDYVVFEHSHQENNRFLHHLLRIPRLADVYRSISNGIRPSQWRLEPEDFLKLTVYLPPLDEQHEIVTRIDDITKRDGRISANLKKQIELLSAYRINLISAAVTGKIQVPTEEAP